MAKGAGKLRRVEKIPQPPQKRVGPLSDPPPTYSWDSLQTPAPVPYKISGPMGARFLSSARVGCGNLKVRGRHRGGKKMGVENLTNDTPPKKGVLDPLVRYVFHPLRLFFLYKNPRESRPEAPLEESKNVRESALSGTFSPPIPRGP